MKMSSRAQEIYSEISKPDTKLGELRKIAKEIKKDHELALELWSIGEFMPRQMAILIMDKKLLSQELVDQLDRDIQSHEYDVQNHLADWLMANQLMKDKATIALIQSWEQSSSPIQRRIYWYYQARLRWTGQTPPDNTEELLNSIEKRIEKEAPEVQWAMNFLAGQVGVYDRENRERCINIGQRSGLYKDEKEVKNCTPNYLPKFIKIEAEKRKLW